ncbi:MAG: hypothetical protein WDN47_01740 [Candidatus Doudnabacteria bacterium]
MNKQIYLFTSGPTWKTICDALKTGRAITFRYKEVQGSAKTGKFLVFSVSTMNGWHLEKKRKMFLIVAVELLGAQLKHCLEWNPKTRRGTSRYPEPDW